MQGALPLSAFFPSTLASPLSFDRSVFICIYIFFFFIVRLFDFFKKKFKEFLKLFRVVSVPQWQVRRLHAQFLKYASGGQDLDIQVALCLSVRVWDESVSEGGGGERERIVSL